jgi:hypothetical protein
MKSTKGKWNSASSKVTSSINITKSNSAYYAASICKNFKCMYGWYIWIGKSYITELDYSFRSQIRALNKSCSNVSNMLFSGNSWTPINQPTLPGTRLELWFSKELIFVFFVATDRNQIRYTGQQHHHNKKVPDKTVNSVYNESGSPTLNFVLESHLKSSFFLRTSLEKFN